MARANPTVVHLAKFLPNVYLKTVLKGNGSMDLLHKPPSPFARLGT